MHFLSGVVCDSTSTSLSNYLQNKILATSPSFFRNSAREKYTPFASLPLPSTFPHALSGLGPSSSSSLLSSSSVLSLASNRNGFPSVPSPPRCDAKGSSLLLGLVLALGLGLRFEFDFDFDFGVEFGYGYAATLNSESSSDVSVM